MRMRDAFASLQLGKKKKTGICQLQTVWSRSPEDGPDAVPLAEYPRPQLKRADWRCLNGWWEYAFRLPGEPMGIADGRILVPFSPETMRSGVGRTLQPGELLWYRTKIEDLCPPEGKRVIVHFGAVDERCSVWWNGTKAGTHRNGYLSFSFDVTEYVCQGTNTLEVCVRDDTDQGTACRGKQTLKPGGMYYHAQSGIWQTVWLETVPECYLRDLKITPLFEEEAVELKLSFDGFPETVSVDERSGKRSGEGSGGRITVFPPSRLDLQTKEKKRDEKKEDLARTGQAASESTAGRVFEFSLKKKVKLRIPVPGPQVWSPENPVLYTFRIEAGEDLAESYFAMRSFGVGKDDDGRPCLLLNGSPYFFQGVLDQGYWPESLMTPPADDAMIFDISRMKELGFNMLRKHVKIEPARWYWHCDRIGMVVWQDMVNGGGPVNKLLVTYLPTIFPRLGKILPDNRCYAVLSRQDAGARKRFEADLRRMIRQLYNCPCIGMWIPFNEGWGSLIPSGSRTISKKKTLRGLLIMPAAGLIRGEGMYAVCTTISGRLQWKRTAGLLSFRNTEAQTAISPAIP